MQRQIALSLAIVLCLTAVAQAEPTILLGIYIVQPNTAGQTIPINVSGIAPNTVNGITLSVMINGGGPAYGGTLGPIITGMDFDSGPTIWGRHRFRRATIRHPRSSTASWQALTS